VLVRANQPLREFNENDGKLTAGSDKVPEGDEEAGKEKAGPLYADENPPVSHAKGRCLLLVLVLDVWVS
jgi:hypothetical protein